MTTFLLRLSTALALGAASMSGAAAQFVDDWPTKADLFAGKTAQMVSVGQTLPRRDLLEPGVRRYVRYAIIDGHRAPVDVWTRRVEQINVDGRPVVRMSMEWDRASDPGKPGQRTIQTADFDAETLAPLNHVRTSIADGEEQSTLFRYDAGEVVAIPADGDADATSTPMPVPAYNFEFDMELFQTLDWSPGKIVDLYFYDPGRSPPASYRFGVIGEESWTGADGTVIDCWIVTSDYNAGEFNKRMWIAKDTQITLHEEVNWQGKIFVKTLIGSERGDREGN